MSEIRHYSISDNYIPLGKFSKDDLPLFTRPESLYISSCMPSIMKKTKAIEIRPSRNANYAAEILIDLKKAWADINQAEFPIHVEVLGALMRVPIMRDYTLLFDKLENNMPLFKPNNNLIWGQDAVCGEIVFSSEENLPQRAWMYKYPVNEIRFSRDMGFSVEGATSDGNEFVYKTKPWEKKSLQVRYSFAGMRKKGKINIPFNWECNGKRISSIVSFSSKDIEPKVSFLAKQNLKWGKDNICGLLKVQTENVGENTLLYSYEKNIIKVKKDKGFRIDGAKEENNNYILSLNPWESKVINVYYEFPKQPINSTKTLSFEYYLNNVLHTEKITYSPVRPPLSVVLSEVPDSVFLSENDQYIGKITLEKSDVYESDFENIKTRVVNSELAKTEKVTESEWKIILKGKILKQLPEEDQDIKIEVSYKTLSETVVLTLSDHLGPQLHNKKNIQLKAQKGIVVKIDKQPVVAYMPVEKVGVNYNIYNQTNHSVTITTPTELGTIPPNKHISSLAFVKPEEGELSIIVLADYMEKQEAKFRIKFQEKQGIGVKCEFSPLDDCNLYQDTEYTKKPCGKLLIKGKFDSGLPLEAYRETTVKIEENNLSDDYSFSFEPSEIIIKPTDQSPKEIMVYLTCKPLRDNELHVRYRHKGKDIDSRTPIVLLHKDYNIDKISLKPIDYSSKYIIKDKNPIMIGVLSKMKSWEKDGEKKYRILKWENDRYAQKTYNKPVESNAIEEEFYLPGGFIMERKDTLDSDIWFNAYEFFLDNPDKLNKPIEFYIDRKWSLPNHSDRWISKQMPFIKFIDPVLEISVIDANGNECDKIDDTYWLNAPYTEDQKEDLFLRVCRINIKNPSVLNDKYVEELRVDCDIEDLFSLSESSLHISLGESSKVDVLMSWSKYKEYGSDSFSFTISGSDIDSLKCTVELKEDRIDDVYSIDLGTSGIVVGKMRNNIPEIVVLKEIDRTNRFEASEQIISSKVFIFDKKEGNTINGNIVISPIVAEVKKIEDEEHQEGSDDKVKQELFLFCPTKFMVGLDRIPYLTNYVKRRCIQDLYFNLNQPDDKIDQNDDKKEIIYPALDFNPEKFVQNIYANIFNRIPGIDRSDIIRKLVLTYPNTYTVEELGKLYEVIVKRFRHLRDFIKFVPESDAVVAYYIQKCLDCPGDNGLYKKINNGKTRIVIYDMGAGTLDLSYVEVNKELCKTEKGKPQVKIIAVIKRRIGIPIAGDYLTRIIQDGLSLEKNDGRIYTGYYVKTQADVVKQNVERVDKDNKTMFKANNYEDSIFDIKEGELGDETSSKIKDYLKIVVATAFDTLLDGQTDNPNRIVMSGRASLFKPLVNEVENYFKNKSIEVEVGQLESSADKMKTSVANGALLYNSMFSESDVRFIKSYNRYHKVGIVYWGINEEGDNCACYEPIIIPSNADWDNAVEQNGMLCLPFKNNKTVDFSNKGYSAFIIECDLPVADIKDLYNQFYKNYTKTDYKKEDLRWAFVNEIKRYRQDGVPETNVEMSISERDNILHVNVGNRVGENIITEKIEGNPFYNCVNK